VTPADVEAAIASEHYFTAFEGVQGAHVLATNGDVAQPFPLSAHPLALLTFCVLVTTNGHTVTGEAHCQDPAKFDAETGKKAARANAIDKLWPMVVYAKRQALLDMAP
jgi:hypothetical protein